METGFNEARAASPGIPENDNSDRESEKCFNEARAASPGIHRNFDGDVWGVAQLQ